MNLSGDYRACRMLVRMEDRDRYLATLFAPPERRGHLFTLYAFNLEIARVADQVREPMLGEIRLQWWHDAIEGRAAGDAARNPVAHALLDTIARHGLPREELHQLIDARAFDVEGEPMENLARLETYLDSTAGTLMRLAAKIAGGGEPEPMARAAREAGRAYAITGLLRSFAPHAARGRIFVPPRDILARHGSDAAEALSGAAGEHLRGALREMRDLARFHLAEARTLLEKLPKSAAATFLPVEFVPDYLARMERADYDPFRTRVEIPPWKKPWLLWRAARKWK